SVATFWLAETKEVVIMLIAIAGASGRTGHVAAQTLLARGAKVRVILRDAAKGEAWRGRGAEVALAALGDVPALTRALRGADGAYLLIPPNFAAPSQREYQQTLARAYAAAVAESGMPHLVFLSSFGAQHEKGGGPVDGLHAAEVLLRAATRTRVSVIRAAYFYENVTPLLAVVKSAGLLPSFFPAQLPVPMVATHDVGILAAELLLDAPKASRIVELGTARSSAEVGDVLGKLLGKPIAVQEAAIESIGPMLTGLGFTADLAGLYVEMIAGIRSGKVAFEGGHRRVQASTPLEVSFRELLASSER
ncbi:MAG TPA: NmrA family NAD(P)-binding protein, partial [Myxococcaceae bacterium]|nr:NmrA family NAD(P)-binding protein [Myxococcaceae bacterium]